MYEKGEGDMIYGWWMYNLADIERVLRIQPVGAAFRVSHFSRTMKFHIIRYGTGEENHAT